MARMTAGNNNSMACGICGSGMKQLFTKTVLGKYEVKYYGCEKCGFVRTETPYWLKEAYRESINRDDTGILARNGRLAETVLPLLFFYGDRHGRYLDRGGGYGIFVRLMRDAGLDFRWSDPYTSNLFAQGFEEDANVPPAAITCFEVMEHCEDPGHEFDAMLQTSPTVIFSTNLHPGVHSPHLSDWDYLAPGHGQHISFYTYGTLQRWAEHRQVYFYSNRCDLHIFSRKKLGSARMINRLLGLRHRYAVFLAELVKLRLKSKTVSDNQQLRNEFREKR